VLDAVRRCAALDFERFLLPLPTLASRVAHIAFAAKVETEFVTRVVRTRKLMPADPAQQDWPWRLQLRVLGADVVLRDGQPLAPQAKRPKKPLQLLALLAAHGHRPVPVEDAVERLWPDTDAESPKGSLEVALARLRKLLDLPGVVLLTDGRLHFDARAVWTDVAAFELDERRWQAGCRSPREDVRAQALANAREALAVYRGPLLGGKERPASWQDLSDQLTRRFSRLVIDCGAQLESQGRWREAHDLYEHGVACDALSEPTYRALMRVQLQLGERAEVLRTFERCRDALHATLGVDPTHETWLLQDRASNAG
jgi:DNA-binding SARP family transcriptional activator